MARSVLNSVFADSIPVIVLRFHVLLQLFAVCDEKLKTTAMISSTMLSQQHTMITSPIRATTTTTTTKMVPDSRCSIDSGLVQNDHSCAAFFVCLKGKAWSMNCESDLLFNSDILTCDLPDKVKCTRRPLQSDGSTCYTAMISVTLSVRNRVRQPTFEAEITFRAPRQPLRYLLLMAAGLDSRFRYETQTFEGYGDYIFAINGVSNDLTQELAAWQVFSKQYSLIVDSLDDFFPEHNDVITFIFADALAQQHV